MGEGVSKVVCLLSALAALGTLSLLARPVVPWMPLLTGSALAVGFLLGRRLRKWGLALGLGLLYIVPGLFYAIFRVAYFPFLPWLAGVLGLTLTGSDVRRWHLPRAWKVPIALWGLTVALSWPVVVLRELDFAPGLTLDLRLAGNGVGTPHTVTVGMALFFPVLFIVGFLWIDYLFHQFGRRSVVDFRRWVLVPLGVSFLWTVFVAALQSLWDIRFMNRPRWVALRAASGGLLDPNPLGLIAALAGPALLAAFGLGRSWVGRAGLLAGLGTVGFGVLASGSRNALWLALTAFAWSVGTTVGATRRTWLRWVWVGLVGVAGFSGLLVIADLLRNTPLYRVVDRILAVRDWRDVPEVLRMQLADRIPFYQVTGAMLREFPLTGIGVGTYHVLVSDYGLRLLGNPLHFDNAQNWYLHQWAELGLLGSLGWGLWMIAFINTVLLRPVTGEALRPAQILKGTLVLFGLSSLVGAHAQDGAVWMTFWVLAFWAARLVGLEAETPSGSAASWKVWAGVGGLALLYAGAQTYIGLHHLRPPFRAATVGWGYTYGFYGPEWGPAVGSFRWTRERAVTILPVQGDRLRFRMFVHHPDAAHRPVGVVVWVDDRRVLDVEFRDHQVHTWEVPLPKDRSRVALTIRVSRTWRPSDYGRPDHRRLGVGVADWTFAGNVTPPDVGVDTRPGASSKGI
ncbi:MAG: O-antigen ligase family protein [Acidobacteria bacterium]|nr:O-antigen ligase family protein [Acidobacteriota bacterium]MDW7984873.1 O-antigen ligase family protein [Acidobacteriota bacterium]